MKNQIKKVLLNAIGGVFVILFFKFKSRPGYFYETLEISQLDLHILLPLLYVSVVVSVTKWPFELVKDEKQEKPLPFKPARLIIPSKTSKGKNVIN